ncbi:unnamed protein product [Leuciscus chuanchicus]
MTCLKMTRKPTVLLEEVESKKIQLFSKLKNCVTNADKKKSWAEITQKINAAGYGYERSPEEVRKKWTDFASVTKRRAAARRREAKKTGGGINSVPPLTAEEEIVFAILGPEALEGIPGGIDACASTRPLNSKLSPGTSGPLHPGPGTSAMSPGLGLLLPSSDSPQSEASSCAGQRRSGIPETQPLISRQRRNRGRCGCSEKLLQSEKKKISELQGIRRELRALKEQQDQHHQEVMAYRRAKLELLQQQASKPSLTMFLPTDNPQM